MRKSLIFTVVGLLAVCGIGGYAVKNASAKGKEVKEAPVATVTRGELLVSVVESGSIDATRSVEVKSRVTGRLARLMVEEGDVVNAGDLVAIIDPKETVLRVEQDEAQLTGAVSAVNRLGLEIEQRRKTAQAAYRQAQARLHQLELEMKTQPTLTQAAITQAETAYNAAQEEKNRLTQSIHPTQRTAAQSAVQEAQANYDNAVREHNRQNELLQKGYVSGRAAESAKLSMDLARVRLDTAKENLARLAAQLNAEVAKADEQIRQAQAELTRAKAGSIQNDLKREEYMSARADLDRARAALTDPAILEKQRDQSRATVAQLRSVVNDSRRQLGETEIRAPISGVVTKKGIQVGELATGLSQFSSGSTIVKIEDRRAMHVKLNVNEIDVAKMTLGMASRIDVDAIPERTYSGIVRKIAPASREAAPGAMQDAVVRYEVEIEIVDATPHLRSGMSAKCTVDVIKLSNVLLLPVEYVQRDAGKYYVYLPPATKEGKAEKREVRVGKSSGTRYEIVSGLKEGDKVEKPKFDGPERKGLMQMGPDEE